MRALSGENPGNLITLRSGPRFVYAHVLGMLVAGDNHALEDSNFPIKSIACRKVGHLVVPRNHYVSCPECPTKFLIKRRSSLASPTRLLITCLPLRAVSTCR